MTNIAIGMTFTAPYGDKTAFWTVISETACGDKTAYECEIKQHPDHYFSFSWLGKRKYFYAGEIERAQRVEDFLANPEFGFWASRTVGETLHYHNGLGGYVRGRVVTSPEGKIILPIALVGHWDDKDLPSRAPDGSIRLPFFIREIRAGNAWAPNETCVWESPDFRPPVTNLDPTTAEPLDISDPAELEGEAALKAKDEALKLQVIRVLSEETDAQVALNKVLNMLLGHSIMDEIKPENQDAK